ncbi:EamA-like transporter family protein [mine drainage metagenome]|uniref:EamA-like transporter family protein n=1 Tax=mine drainage metagenome TaxID=410659 RepID=A0A1J5RFS9_9ZZZZ
MQNYAKGVLFCLIATLSWGGMFPVMNSALIHIDPFTFTSLRYTLAGLAFLALLIYREGLGALNLKQQRLALAWLFGTAGFAGFGFLVFLGQKMAGPEGALTASIMMATQPMLGLVVNRVLRKVVPPVYSVFFILLSFCGIALVVTKGDPGALLTEPQSFVADALILLGALCWVVYTIGGTFFPKWSPYKYTAVTTGLGLLSVYTINMVLLITGVIDVPSVSTLRTITPELAYMALVAGFLGVLSWNFGNRILTPRNGVLFMDVVPVTAFLISAAQGIVPDRVQIVGACFTGFALICNNIFMRLFSTLPPRTTPSPLPDQCDVVTARD